MPRPIWSGAISFGLVSVPVKLYPAVSQKDVSFHQIDKKSGARIRYKRVSEKTGREVPYDQIAKGYEVSDGEYVVIDREELDAVRPEMTRRIDITDFVDLDEIDPVYYESTYYLAPDKGGGKAYGLLLRAMDDTKKVAVGKVVIRGKQYLTAIRPFGARALALQTMLFGDEVVDVTSVPGVPERKPPVGERELRMAKQLVDSLAGEWDPGKYSDDYRAEVTKLIKKKAKGQTIQVAERAEETPKVVDLLEALRASVEQSGGGRSAKPHRRKRATRHRRSA